MRLLLTGIIFFAASSLFAQEWEYAHPFSDTKARPEFNERYLREAYVKYRLADHGKTMVIDLHDQFLRAGDYSDYIDRQQRAEAEDVFVDVALLKRVFILLSGIDIAIETPLPAWWMTPNFGWLDKILRPYAIDVIFKALHSRFPELEHIEFCFDSEGSSYTIDIPDYTDKAEALMIEVTDKYGIKFKH